MTANYDLPSVVEKRVRFFDGQFLQDQDFIDEQKYHLDRERRHLRLLHVAGVADGLAVTASASEPNSVTVAPGTAIDSDGRQLALAEAATVDLPATLNGKQGVELYLSYRESAVDVQTAKGSSDLTRWLEHPELTAVAPGAAYAGATPPVLLARMALDTAGRVTVDGTVRAYSGLRLPGAAADAPTLRSTAGGQADLAGSLTVDGNVGIGTTSSEQRLTVKGDLKFTDVATISGADRLHISGEELLYLLNKSGVIVGKEWGGTGSLTVEGDLEAASASVDNTLYIKRTLGIGISEPGALLSIVSTDASELMGSAQSALFRISGYPLGAGVGNDVVLSSTGLLLDDTYNVSLGVRAVRTTAKTATVFGPGTMAIGLSMDMDNQAYYGAALFLGSNRSVGIGTSTPSALLSVVDRTELAGRAQSGVLRVSGGTLAAGLYSEVALSSTGLVVDKADSVSLGVRAIRTTEKTTTVSGWSTMAIGLGIDVGDTARRGAALLLHSNGNIGIGTIVTPSARLSLVDMYATELTGKAQAGLLRISGGALNTLPGSEVALTSTGLVVDKDSVSLGVRVIRAIGSTRTASGWSTTAIGLSMDVNDTARSGAALFFNANGNVGIGTSPTTLPDQRLTISGDLKFTDTATIWGGNRLHITGKERLYLLNKDGVFIGKEWEGNGNLTVEGDLVVMGANNITSDARLKQRIRRLEQPLDRLTGVRGVSYLPRQVGGRDDRSEERPAIGVLAQEVEAVFPQLVSTIEGNGYKAVNYNGLTAVLLEAVKELKTALDALQARVAMLEAHA